jgi:diacylglycerol kinase (CTP)
MKRSGQAKTNEFFTTGLPVRLHLRSDLHLARKLWHMSMGLLAAAVYMSGMPRPTAVIIVCSLLGLNVFVEMARLRMPALNEKFIKFWGPIMRSSEADRVSGVPYYLASVALTVGIFPKPIAILSIAYLACGDPIASLTGILYGDKGLRFANGKSLIGTLAGVLACAVLTFIFLSAFHLKDSAVLGLTLIGGLAGGLAELLPLEVDDNFSIPVVSGFTLWLAFILLGI